jgi:hypothetical protein
MRKQGAVAVLIMLVFAGAGSSTILAGASARSKPLTAIQQGKRVGPKPTPHWYWRWQNWRLGEGYAKGHQLQRPLRPRAMPRHVPRWAWRRLHFVLVARTRRTAGHSRPAVRGGGETYERAIAYTRTRPSFSPSRIVDVSTASQFESALSNLQAGDLVRATGSFTISGKTVISNRLSSWAVLDLSSKVTFDYSGGANYPAVWLKNPSHLRIYGGILTTDGTGGACILSHGMQHVLWWGFVCHDAGNTGVALYSAESPTTNNDFQGEVYRAGENLAWDPHAERGSGLHAVNLDDLGNHAFSDNRFAFYIHDQPTGAGIEYGTDGTAPVRNTIYERAANLTFVSRTQTGGNAIQFWGVSGQSADIKYLRADNIQGRALQAGGMFPGAKLSGVRVEYGHASRTNLNPRYAGQSPWDRRGGVAYTTVRPAP